MYKVSRLGLYLDDDAAEFDELEAAEINAIERSWDDSAWGVFEIQGDGDDEVTECVSIAYERRLFS